MTFLYFPSLESEWSMILSIIIPTFKNLNGLDLLLTDLNNYSHLTEIIVVDDDPECSAKFLCDSYSSVIYYKNTKSKGAGGARNLGLEHASGTYVTFVDSDDRISENFELVLQTLSDLQHKDVIFYRPSAVHINTQLPSKRAIKYQKIIDNYTEKNDIDLRLGWYVPWSKILLKNFLIANQIYFEEVSHSNDVMFSTKIGVLMKNFVVKNDSFYIVTESENGLTREINTESLITRINEVEKYNGYLYLNGYKNQRITPYRLYIKLIKKSVIKGSIHTLKSILFTKTPLIDRRIINKICNV